MGRPVDPTAPFRVKLHRNGEYTYASTQPSFIDNETGKRTHRIVNWGKVDENRSFIPGPSYYLASPSERAQLIFPEDWDMSKVEKAPDANPPVKQTNSTGYQNRLYGDIWLLEQIAERTGIRQDLETVFGGNVEIVDDILTLAMFPYITEYTYNRVARWQRLVKAPSSRPLTPAVITRLTQSITEQNRMSLLKLRALRLEKDELCAVDSTSRSAYGDSLTDIHWGKNKDCLPLAQTLEVVVYTLSSHMPIYYRTFPGNMPDSRSLDVILADLEHAGFQDFILITDRGYETMHNLKEMIHHGQAFITCAKTGQTKILSVIRELGEFGARPNGMEVDTDAKIYYKQVDLEYKMGDEAECQIQVDRLKLNLYFDPMRRSAELLELDIAITLQKAELEELLKRKGTLDAATIKENYNYYNVTVDPVTMVIQSYEVNEKKVSKASALSGFFSMITHKLDYDAVKTLNTYCLRDEQEKYFEQMKSQMVSDRQRNWSEEGKTGRLFILFVSLVLSSYVRHIWKSSDLYNSFSSSLEVLDEMRDIRCIEREGNEISLTPFVGEQIEICKNFHFDLPEGCAPNSASRQTTKRKRGRPPKKK